MIVDHQINFAITMGSEGIGIDPYTPSFVQPASVDLRLGSDFIRYDSSYQPLDPEYPEAADIKRFQADRLVILPGEFILGTTIEKISLGVDFAARVEGKSTLGRLGLIVHSTAGFVDPGFQGNITLEMTNINARPIILRSEMKICQIAFYRLDAAAEVPYGHVKLGSHYHNQVGVTPAAALRSNI